MATKIALVDLIRNWLAESSAHHVVYWYDGITYEIECKCAIAGFYKFLIHEDRVTIYQYRTKDFITLNAANPNFFGKLQFFLEQDCDKRLL